VLIPASELDTRTRVNCFIRGVIALDRQTGKTLRRSAGRRKAGVPTKYVLEMDGYYIRDFLATSDQEAIDKANEGQTYDQ
jgi:hypothetical protein